MASTTTKTRKRTRTSGGGHAAHRKERTFLTSQTFMKPGVFWLGMAGALALGAGVYSQWLMDEPLSFASYIVAAGGFLLGAALWLAQADEVAVRIGDAGVFIDQGREGLRVHWFEMKRISLRGDRVSIETTGRELSFSRGANEAALAWLLKEASERLPQLIDVPKSLTESLPKPSEEGASHERVEDQVSGRNCAHSGQAITLEEDARVCPNCGQIYHKSHIPSRCLHCDTELSGKTLRA